MEKKEKKIVIRNNFIIFVVLILVIFITFILFKTKFNAGDNKTICAQAICNNCSSDVCHCTYIDSNDNEQQIDCRNN